MHKTAVGAIVARGDGGAGNGSDGEEADKWMVQEIFRREICQPW